MAATDPVGAAQAVQQIPYLANNASGVTDTADVSLAQKLRKKGASPDSCELPTHSSATLYDSNCEWLMYRR
ncbi:hypothetical protein IE81DRAFT_322654 [Ceraceosorus guamensis]|uniref:Uncharacterized protein n=1 Tax=Ceraceosorus guamensis TaxID=1522189 RepID=A0A316W037_9BASI|nr:hypothetical protein IE81DRAFT_322654 [Ceraceosorus guamensis]PWN43140.1 hypothetical protein IE81DRAFT_322654 [Ceraceosorus guamensis]